MSTTVSTTITHPITLTAAQTTITGTGGVVASTTGAAVSSYSSSPLTLTNFGSIINNQTGFAGFGVVARTAIIQNEAGAVIHAAAAYGVQLSGYSGDFRTIHNTGVLLPQPTVVNAGTITGGSGAISGGIDTYILNQQTGLIAGDQVGITFGGYPNAGSTIWSGTVVNAGTIIDHGGVAGIQFLSGVRATVVNSGVITTTPTGGGTYEGNYGVVLTQGGVITNTGTIAGTYFGLYFSLGGSVLPGSVTVTNAGTIKGGSAAIKFQAAQTNLMVVDPGAVFIGNVIGGSAASSTLELAAGGAGTIVGFGSKYSNFGTLTFDANASWRVSASGAGITAATINGFDADDAIDITNFTATSYAVVAGGQQLVLTNSVGTQETLSFGAPISNFHVTGGAFGTEITTLCFCAGTMIDTPGGEVAVEHLAVGDTVRTLGNGGTQAIAWIGVGKVLATRGQRGAATPVIVRRNALADNVPARDLHVTKGHSLYLDGVLIPVEFLVNHRSILWDDRAQEVSLYHIELAAHDVLLANGAPAESYRDDGNRWLFRNANSGWGRPPPPAYAEVLTGGPVVDAVWRRLLDRAGPRGGLPLTDDPDLHLLVDGRRVDAERRSGGVYVFVLREPPSELRVVSRAGAPQEYGLARDPRVLGVALRQIRLRQPARLCVIDAEDARLAEGFHGFEPDQAFRWTNGDAVLPTALFAGFTGAAELVLTVAGAMRYLDEGLPLSA